MGKVGVQRTYAKGEAMTPLRQRAERLAEEYFKSHGDSRAALVPLIHAALQEVVEECAKVAANEIGSTRREIAAAIRHRKGE